MQTLNDAHLTAEEIKAWKPYTEYPEINKFNEPLKQRMLDIGQYKPNQAAGRRWGIGCVSLEITQRCNLDCTLCYLSDQSEAVKDIPLQEVFRRIDMIYRHYGPTTDIQISGGDPTLRDRKELVQIVKRIVAYKMQCSLFTNGIKASRDLLEELAAAGMNDVAFHVDLTQERKGYATEADLNKVRLQYMERAKGLGLNVFFNTTVYDGNFKQIPDLVRFFRANADKVDLISFQLQADTGRGVLRERDFMITQDSVTEQIELGAGTKIHFDMPMIGHPKCNRKAIMFETGGHMHNMADTRGFIEKMVTYAPQIERNDHTKTIRGMLNAIFARPSLWVPALRFVGGLLWNMKADLVRSKGKVEKLTFFIHNFMDASKLEKDRCHGCVFMVATADGPVSMCVHNAKRDDFILKPFKVKEENGTETLYDPLTPQPPAARINVNKLKGRVKKQVLETELT